jgi:hypothetical protein
MIVAVNATEPETCDDGDTDDTDECPTNCQNATCGDGFVLDGGGVRRQGYGVRHVRRGVQAQRVLGVRDELEVQRGRGHEPGGRRRDLHTLAEKKSILAGVYKAWLSDGHERERAAVPLAGPLHAAKQGQGRRQLDDLTDGNLDLAISRDETGTPISINPPPRPATPATRRTPRCGRAPWPAVRLDVDLQRLDVGRRARARQGCSTASTTSGRTASSRATRRRGCTASSSRDRDFMRRPILDSHPGRAARVQVLVRGCGRRVGRVAGRGGVERRTRARRPAGPGTSSPGSPRRRATRRAAAMVCVTRARRATTGRATASDRACTPECAVNTCGDGYALAGVEACDDGDDDDDDECVGCQAAVCGDGAVYKNVESCDGAGESPDCDADCSVASCGDGTQRGRGRALRPRGGERRLRRRVQRRVRRAGADVRRRGDRRRRTKFATRRSRRRRSSCASTSARCSCATRAGATATATRSTAARSTTRHDDERCGDCETDCGFFSCKNGHCGI